MTDALRVAAGTAGIIAAALLAWRLLGTWLDTTVLVHVLGILLLTTLVLGAIAVGVNAHNNAPYNPVVWLILLHRLAVIALALMWPHWLERRNPPWQRPHFTA